MIYFLFFPYPVVEGDINYDLFLVFFPYPVVEGDINYDLFLVFSLPCS